MAGSAGIQNAVASFWPSGRVRRLIDVMRLVMAGAALAVLISLVSTDTGWLTELAEVVPQPRQGLPRIALSVANGLFSLAVLGVLIVLTVQAVRSRRFALTSAVLACALGVSGGLLLAHAAGWTAGDDALVLLVGRLDDSAALPVIAALAAVVGADLEHRRLLAAARLSLLAVVACDLGLGTLTPLSGAFAVVTGFAAGLGIRVGLGVVPSRPPQQEILAVLARAGYPLSPLRIVEDRAGWVRFAGTLTGGSEVRVTVVDRDLRGVPLARRAWRLLRLRTAAVGRPALSPRRQLEQQALSAALAHAAGVATPRMLALLPAGTALLLVERPLGGTPLTDVAGGDTAAGIDTAAHALRRLHDAGVAHGAITAEAIVMLADGRAGFAGLSAAQPAATELQRELDVVAFLVVAATKLGATAAVESIRAEYNTTPTAETRLAALLQPVALTHRARQSVRRTSILADLRSALSGPVTPGSSPGRARDRPARVERLRPRTVISLAGGTLAAYILATQLSKVSLADAVRPAHPGWVLLVVLGSALTYLGSALIRTPFFPVVLPLARTALVQLASSFVTLVTPPAVGHIGLNIRYLQRAGVATAAAAGCIAVSEAVTIAITVLIVLGCAWLSGTSSSQLSLLPDGTVLIVVSVAAALVALAFSVPASRRLLRRRLRPLLRSTVPQLIAAVSDPRKLGAAVVGVFILNGGYVLALDAALRAFSTTISLPILVVVYFAASTIASAVPTPGGVGAVEAALVAALSAAGAPVAAALSAVLLFRIATFWLPAPIGWGAFVSLQRRGRI